MMEPVREGHVTLGIKCEEFGYRSAVRSQRYPADQILVGRSGPRSTNEVPRQWSAWLA